jgi:hypothetical protein
MNIKFIVFLLFVSFKSFSQSTLDKDSLITKMCETLKENSSFSDTIKMKAVMEKHLSIFLKYLNDSSKMDELNQIDIRFQRQCKEYGELIDRINIQKGDWKRVNAKPNTELKKEVCLDFLKYENYYYLSSNGDTVRLAIDKYFWVDHFKDGTYSKLKFYWINDCEFEIEFIESDNYSRKQFSKPGDKYKYQILNKDDKSYFMSAEIVGTSQFMTFKLYY